jgi:hypothetical protein
VTGSLTARARWPAALVLALWVFALLAALAAAPAGFVYRDGGLTSNAMTDLGLRMYGPRGHWRLSEPLSGEGGLATIRHGDEIIAINGKPAPADAPLLQAMTSAAPGPYVMLRTRSLDGAVRDHLLRRSSDHLRNALQRSGLSLSAFESAESLSLLTWAVGVAASVLIFLRRRRDPVAVAFSFGFLIQAAATAFYPGHSRFGLPGELAFHLGSAMGDGLLMLALLYFPTGRLEVRGAPLLAGAIVLWSIGAGLWGLNLVPPPPNVINATVGSLLPVLCLVVQIVRYRALAPGPQRQQIRWVLFGFAAAAIALAASTLAGDIGEEASDPARWAWLLIASDAASFLIVLFGAGGLVISVVRYRLFDADTVISRSAGYAILTLALAGLWAGAEKALEVVFEGQFGHEAGAVSAGVAAALAALLVTPAHHRVMHWTEQVFQKGLARLRNDLPEYVGDLRETASVARLLDAVLARVSDGVRAHRAAVVLRDGKELKVAAVRGTDRATAADWLKTAQLSGDALSSDREDAQFPLRLPLVVTAEGREVVGWLLLGPRPDGSFYGMDELDALRDVAEPIARAVHIARLREGREIGLTRELKAIRAELATLRPAVT